MEPSVIYRLSRDFDPVARLAGGETEFEERSPEAMPATALLCEEYFQLRLAPVSGNDIDGLPPLSELAPAMIRDCLVAIRGARFSWHLEVHSGQARLRSSPLVCAEMRLTERLQDASIVADKQSEIERALEHGLLDEDHYDIANFRLRMRRMREQLAAIRSSGYVPDWRLVVLYSSFRDVGSGEWTTRPFADAGSDAAEFSLLARPRRRGFRMTDLFRQTRAEEGNDQ